jgi:HEAT repeat protein
MKGIDDTFRNLYAARNDPSEAGRLMTGLAECRESVIPLLVAALGSTDPDVRSGAAMAAGYIGFYSDGRCDVTPAIPLLIEAADAPDPWVAFHAARSLWMLWKEGKSRRLDADGIVDRIAACLESGDPGVRAAAAEILWLVGSRADRVIPRLVANLDDPLLAVRFATACVLACTDRTARRAASKFTEWVHGDVPEQAFVAAVALMQTDAARRDALVPVILESFGRLGDVFRAKAVYSLFWLLEHEPRFFTMLAGCYEESHDRDVRRAIVDVLAGNVREVGEARSVLARALLDEEPDVVDAAAAGLRALGQGSGG